MRNELASYLGHRTVCYAFESCDPATVRAAASFVADGTVDEAMFFDKDARTGENGHSVIDALLTAHANPHRHVAPSTTGPISDLQQLSNDVDCMQRLSAACRVSPSEAIQQIEKERATAVAASLVKRSLGFPIEQRTASMAGITPMLDSLLDRMQEERLPQLDVLAKVLRTKEFFTTVDNAKSYDRQIQFNAFFAATNARVFHQQALFMSTIKGLASIPADQAIAVFEDNVRRFSAAPNAAFPYPAYVSTRKSSVRAIHPRSPVDRNDDGHPLSLLANAFKHLPPGVLKRAAMALLATQSTVPPDFYSGGVYKFLIGDLVYEHLLDHEATTQSLDGEPPSTTVQDALRELRFTPIHAIPEPERMDVLLAIRDVGLQIVPQAADGIRKWAQAALIYVPEADRVRIDEAAPAGVTSLRQGSPSTEPTPTRLSAKGHVPDGSNAAVSPAWAHQADASVSLLVATTPIQEIEVDDLFDGMSVDEIKIKKAAIEDLKENLDYSTLCATLEAGDPILSKFISRLITSGHIEPADFFDHHPSSDRQTCLFDNLLAARADKRRVDLPNWRNKYQSLEPRYSPERLRHEIDGIESLIAACKTSPFFMIRRATQKYDIPVVASAFVKRLASMETNDRLDAFEAIEPMLEALLARMQREHVPQVDKLFGALGDAIEGGSAFDERAMTYEIKLVAHLDSQPGPSPWDDAVIDHFSRLPADRQLERLTEIAGHFSKDWKTVSSFELPYDAHRTRVQGWEFKSHPLDMIAGRYIEVLKPEVRAKAAITLLDVGKNAGPDIYKRSVVLRLTYEDRPLGQPTTCVMTIYPEADRLDVFNELLAANDAIHIRRNHEEIWIPMIHLLPAAGRASAAQMLEARASNLA